MLFIFMRKSWELFKLNLSLWSLTNYDLEVINGIIHGSLYFIIGRKARTIPLYKVKYFNTIQKKSWWKSKRNPDQNFSLRQTRRGVPYNQIGSPLVLGGESGTRKFSEQTFARELKLSGLSQLSTFNFHRVFRTPLFLHYAPGLRSAVWLLWNFKSFPASALRAEMWSFIALFGGGMDHLRDVSAVDTCDCVCLCK